MKLAVYFFLITALIGYLLSGCNDAHDPEWLDSCDSAPAFTGVTVPMNADALAFRQKFQAGSAVSIAIIGDSTTLGIGAGSMPNAVQLLNTYVKTINPSSVVYNYGIGGTVAADHIAYGTVASISMVAPRPNSVFIALGINDTFFKTSQLADLQTLVGQVRGYGMLPVLVHENNISCMNIWHPSPFWQFVRYEVDAAAKATNVDVIELGSPDGVIDHSLLSDMLHPNGAGYQVIFDKYKAWLNL